MGNAKLELECAECGQEFERYRSNVDQTERNFCSQDCYHDANKEKDGLTEEQIAGLRQGWEMSYKFSKEEKLKLGPAKGTRNSPETEFTSEEITGEDHPNWKGGYNGYYGSNWSRQRKKALKRDNHKCQDCNATADDVNYRLEVHHKIPYRKFDDYREANRLDNLITVCRSCHMKREHG